MESVILTKEFCQRAISKINNLDSLTVDEVRYIAYFTYFEISECVPEGTTLVHTCNNLECVSPYHSKLIPPKENYNG